MKTICEKSASGRAWVSDAVESDGAGIVSDFLAGILASRGVVGRDKILEFINPSIKNQMPDPDTLFGMECAVKIVADSVADGRKIAVFGDYDVDGITSTAIMIKYFTAIGVDAIWHLPSREGEGYGLNKAAISEFHDAGVGTIITVDCGISGVAESAFAKTLGMEIVITDHHSPDNNVPDADAVIDPKLPADESGLDYLAGVGVAYMFLVALNRELRNRGFFKDDRAAPDLMLFTDLVALGTVADTMPLVGLNRAFVATGLQVMAQRKNIGLSALMDIAGAKSPSVYVAGFVLGPRLNAAGRLKSPEPSLKLLLTDNRMLAADLASELNNMNAARKDIENAIMLSATEMAAADVARGRHCIMVAGDNWHGGVMGIIAGRLKDKFSMPTCIATKNDGMINGSGRSIPGVNLGHIIHEALDAGILTEGGGHAAAAGFSLDALREEEFREFLENAVIKQLNGAEIRPEILVDAEIDAAAANMTLAREMSAIAPFGQGNPEPTLVLRGGALAWASHLSGNHLRGNIRAMNGVTLPFVGFNMADTDAGRWLLDEANFNAPVILCGKLKENEYNGRVSVQFVVEDIAK